MRSHRTLPRAALAFALGGAFCACAMAQRVNWVALDKVSLTPDPANDGDSFHARRNRSNYLLRLYFVDAPETDTRFPERLKEQADYFGVSSERVVEGGKRATEFTRRLLEVQPFEVHTKYVDARGASQQERIYAMVKVQDRWLCEWLVESGLARLHGLGDTLPDGVEERRHWSRLRTLENAAKREKRGLWGSGIPESAKVGGVARTILPRRTPILSTTPPFDVVGHLPAGHAILPGESVRTGYRLVTFMGADGAEATAVIQESFLK